MEEYQNTKSGKRNKPLVTKEEDSGDYYEEVSLHEDIKNSGDYYEEVSLHEDIENVRYVSDTPRKPTAQNKYYDENSDLTSNKRIQEEQKTSTNVPEKLQEDIRIPTTSKRNNRTTIILLVISLIVCAGLASGLLYFIVREYSDNSCTQAPYLNGGQCGISGVDYNCACPRGFYGFRCESSPCSDQPCLNNGSCTVWKHAYNCSCSEGFVGGECEVQLWRENPRDCGDISPGSNSGIYRIYPSSMAVDVYCDMTSDGGGWTVIQRREDGSVDFYRNWTEYKYGFGDVDKEHWLGKSIYRDGKMVKLFYRDWNQYKHGFGDVDREHWQGNDNIHRLTSQADYKLRIYIEDYHSASAVVVYYTFNVCGETDEYRIQVHSYNGTIGDSMSHHDGMKFSATDVENDLRSGVNCVTDQKYGGWWYNSCADANLNGRYGTKWGKGGIYWLGWHGYTPLNKTIMMCKRN